MNIEEGNNRYYNIHQWIKRHYGKASKCESKTCNSVNPKRFEWALVKGMTYEKNINNYIQLCVSCHRIYDFTESKRKNMSEAKLNGTRNDKAVICIMNNGELKEYRSICEANRLSGISLTGIYNSLNNKSTKWKKKSTQYEQWMYKSVIN